MNLGRLRYALAFLVLLAAALLSLPDTDVVIRDKIPEVGQIMDRTIVATLTFDIPKNPGELEKEQRKAKERIPAYFSYDEDRSKAQLVHLDTLLEKIARYSTLQVKLANLRKPSQELTQEAADIFQNLSTRLSSTAIKQLAKSVAARDTLKNVFHKMVDNGISDILLVENKKQAELYKATYSLEDPKTLTYSKPEVILIQDGQEVRRKSFDLLPRERAVENAFSQLQIAFPKSQALQSAFFEVLYAFSRPNIIYLPKETKQQQTVAVQNVNPSKGKIVKGMEVIQSGAIVSQEIREKLSAMEQAILLNQSSEEERNAYIYPRLGRQITITLLVLFFCVMYMLFMANKERAPIETKVLALVAILAIQFFLIYLTGEWGIALEQKGSQLFPETFDSKWLAPYLFGPILITLLLDLRTGVASAILVGAYLGVTHEFDLMYSISIISITIPTIYFLREIRYRSQFVLAGLIAITAFLVVFFVESLLRNQLSREFMLPNIYGSTAMILISSALTIMFLSHLFERIFKLTTHLTLIELADFNNPILKNFSANAPSSFHHSIMVANLAEKAAQSIDADALLTRVMSLYHDIGKSVNPQNFTENQKTDNPHDDLNPWDSARKIRAHVENGIKLAKEYRLPPVIASAIPEHHGDNIIRYFYKKACAESDTPVDDSEFRYGGPRPQSKETAIIMMADGIEAASRSLEDPSPEELTSLVQKIIYSRLYENQLNESNITLSDLQEIEVGFLKALEGMFHTRIKYPEGIFATIPANHMETNKE